MEGLVVSRSAMVSISPCYDDVLTCRLSMWENSEGSVPVNWFDSRAKIRNCFNFPKSLFSEPLSLFPMKDNWVSVVREAKFGGSPPINSLWSN